MNEIFWSLFNAFYQSCRQAYSTNLVANSVAIKFIFTNSVKKHSNITYLGIVDILDVSYITNLILKWSVFPEFLWCGKNSIYY